VIKNKLNSVRQIVDTHHLLNIGSVGKSCINRVLSSFREIAEVFIKVLSKNSI